jgi:hypothetical protein
MISESGEVCCHISPSSNIAVKRFNRILSAICHEVIELGIPSAPAELRDP